MPYKHTPKLIPEQHDKRGKLSTEAMRKHRQHKQELYLANKLKDNNDN